MALINLNMKRKLKYLNLDAFKNETQNKIMEESNMEEVTLVLTKREAEFIRNIMMCADLTGECNDYRDIIISVSRQLPKLTVSESISSIKPIKGKMIRQRRKRWMWPFIR